MSSVTHLTTAAQSDHSHGVSLNLTNINGTTAGNSAGITLSLSAAGGAGDGYNIIAAGGSTANSTGTIVFSNSNGVSFGLNGGTVTATVATNYQSQGAYLTTAMQSNAATISNIKVSAGTLSSNRSDITFNNSNGVTFGLETNGVITATVATNYQAPGAYLTTAMASNRGSDFMGTNTALTANGLSVTANSSGLSINVPAWLTTAAQSDHSHGNPTLALTNLTGTTASASNGFTLSLSAAAPGAGGGIAAAAGTQTQTSGTLAFVNSNNITFGMSNSSQITASFNPINIGMSTNGNTAGTTGTYDGAGLQYVLIGGNNITLSQSANGSSVSLSINAAAPGGGAGATLSHYMPPWGLSGRATNSSLGNNTLYFQPFDLPYYLSASRINFYISISGALSAGNSTGSCWQRASYGLYSQDSAGASTQSIRLITSYAITHLSHTMNSNTRYAATHYFGLSNATSHSTLQTGLSTSNATTYLATNLNGPRVLAFPLNSTLTPGRYWLAFGNATTAGNAMTNNLSVFHTSVGIQPEVRPFGQASSASNASVFRPNQGWGSYSATTAAFPSPIALSTDQIRHGVAMTQIHFDILGIATSTNQI